MANTTEQIAGLGRRVDGLQSAITGLRPHPGILAAVGPVIHWGCRVTQGSSAADLIIALESQAAGDELNHNPLIETSPLYAAQYGNISTTIGGPVYTSNLSAIMESAPGDGLGRYDIAYIALGPSGPIFGILTGTPSIGVKGAFDIGGLITTPYDSATDAAIPVGAMAVARIYIEGTDTGIGNARIADLRNFEGRLKGAAITWADLTLSQKNELIDPATAAASAAVLADNETFKAEQRTLFWLGI